MLHVDTQSTPVLSRGTLARDSAGAPLRPRLEQSDARATDALELSDAAEQAARDVPTVRRELIERIQAEIEAGRYLTPEKLDIAAENLLAELRRA